MKKQIFNLYRKTQNYKSCAKAVLLCICSILFLFTSCQNALTEDYNSNTKTGSITGSIDFGGALPKEIYDKLNNSSKNSGPQGERTAFPSIPSSDCTLQVYAQIGSNADTRVDASIIPGTKKYSIENLTYGEEYTITAKYIFNENIIIMQGSEKVTLSDDEPVVNKNISVAPTQTEDGEGSISLSFSVAGDVGWSGSNVNCSYFLDNNLKKSNYYQNDGIFSFEENYISSGVHSVKFIFKPKGTNYILYQFTETINVFDNLTTNTWVKNGDEPYLTTNVSGELICNITKECVDKFTQTTFYVDSSRQTTNPSAPDYTTESGTYFNPFVKVSSAFDRINESSNADYTIYVKDGHSEDFEGIEFDKNISIETYKDTPGDGLGQATLKMKNGASTFLSIKNNTKFSIKNFILDGNYVENGGDGGIITNLGNTTLINCELKKGSTCGNGGAVWNYYGASITLENCNIHECSSKENCDGGGIYNSGTITIDNTVISGCTAGDKFNNQYGNGGGIYNDGTLTFKGKCVIGDETQTITASANAGAGYYSNYANNGGGIYTETDFTVDSNATLFVNYNSAYLCGGGVYVESFTSSLSNVVVKYCSSYESGGGVYIINITNTSGLKCINFDIENCESNTCGGIYCNSSVTISNSKVLNCTGTQQGGGIYFTKSSTLENVCVENCSSSLSNQGNGAYVDYSSSITLKGNTYFGTNDDIFLDSILYNYTEKIKIDEELSPKDQNGNDMAYVATIRPSDYTKGIQVLTGSKVGSEYTRFAVKPENDNSIPFHIGSDGKLFSAFGIKPKGAALAVGDIVFNDGSSTPYSVIASRNPVQCKDYEKNAAVAVIYKAESNKAYGVGIKYAANIAWCIEDSNGDDINFTNTVSTNDGIMNLQRMISKDADDTGVTCNADGTIDFDNSDQDTLRQNYPAFEFAYYYGKNEGHNTKGTDYETGWYLPSMSELSDICNAYTSTDNALSVTGGDRLYSRYFLSSNQGNYTNWTKSLCLATRQEGGYYTYDTGSSACAVRAFTW